MKSQRVSAETLLELLCPFVPERERNAIVRETDGFRREGVKLGASCTYAQVPETLRSVPRTLNQRVQGSGSWVAHQHAGCLPSRPVPWAPSSGMRASRQSVHR